MRLIIIGFLLGRLFWVFIRGSCWLKLERHAPAWVDYYKPNREVRLCASCGRPLFPFIRRKQP